jgi:galactonate dehydratase
VESTPIPIATGERLFLRTDFQDVLRTGLAVAQPDISHAGGISELRRIAAMAETYNVFMAPHSPLGPINLAASLQLDFATPNFLIQEQVLGLGNPGTESNTHKFVDYSDFKVKDGYVELMTKPGLGIEVDEEAVAYVAANTKPWHAPDWTGKDGALAEW